MKKAIVGFVIILGVIVISTMYRASSTEMVQHAQEVQTASQNRPRDLQLLKRPAIRAACTTHSDWDMETCQTMDAKEVSIGMNAEQVRLSWGKPEKINATETASTNHEQWVYGRDQYLYMENGLLKTMQTPR